MKHRLLRKISTLLLAVAGWLLILLLPLLLADPLLPLGEEADIRWLLAGLTAAWSAVVGSRLGRELYPRWARAGVRAAFLCLALVLLSALALAPDLLTPAFAALLVILLLPPALAGALAGAGRCLYAQRLAAADPEQADGAADRNSGA